MPIDLKSELIEACKDFRAAYNEQHTIIRHIGVVLLALTGFFIFIIVLGFLVAVIR